MSRARIHLLLSLAAVAALGACEERRVVAVRGGLTGMPGAQGALVEERGRAANSPGAARSQSAGSYAELEARTRAEAESAGEVEPGSLRVVHEDGSVTLISTAPRHVVTHLRRLIAEENADLLFDQLLSDRAKEHYRVEGRDPREAVAFLLENRREVLKLLARMPMGESTPGLYLRRIGPSAYRLEVASKGDLRLTRLDVVWERGVCRLLLIS